MKHLFTLAILISSVQIFAQGTIEGLSVSPAAPTENDIITIYADVQFSSGSCDLDNQGHNVNVFTINAFSHHCVGLATVICPATDEFEIGQLPAGDYIFDFTLSSGQGGPGCSAGIIADDTDQFTFTVSASVGIEEVSLDSKFAYPNPVSDVLNFKSGLKESAIITDVRGIEILQINPGTVQTDLSTLSAGIYFLSTEFKRLRFVKN
jgi:hypothetical protein